MIPSTRRANKDPLHGSKTFFNRSSRLSVNGVVAVKGRWWLPRLCLARGSLARVRPRISLGCKAAVSARYLVQGDEEASRTVQAAQVDVDSRE